MKLTLGLSAALAGFAAAAQQSAPVYILSGADADADTKSTTPSLPPSLARLVLLQRLAPAGKGPSISDLPQDVDTDTAVSMMNKFGGQSISMFGEAQQLPPSQLVIMLEGLSDEQIYQMGKKFPSGLSFEVSDPPSSGAHDKLVKNDFFNVGITNEHSCSIKEVTNPFEERCWSGKSTVAKYDVRKHPEVISDLESQLSNLQALGKSEEMETTVVLLPANGEAKKWSDKTQELRRREVPVEHVITAVDDETAEAVVTALSDDEESTEDQEDTQGTSENTDAGTIFYAASGSIPSCFGSEEDCSTATGNCSGHGSCQNKYVKRDGSEGKESCFVCHCLSTQNDGGGLTHWAGLTCAKKDISTPFWLFAGFTLVMVGILSLSIGMLFGVGEEKLPGVIGAGVSRNN